MILVAYLFAIPASEIVIPTVLMLTVLVTGVMLFSPTHNPCSTTLTVPGAGRRWRR